MIFFNILLFFVSIVLLSVSISGYGKLIRLKVENNFFLEIFLGFVIISFLITVIHFFFKINFFFASLIFLFLWLIFLKNNNYNLLSLFKKKNIPYLILIFLFIPMFLSQKYNEDFGYYHLPYALGFIEEKIIFGFANINLTYVYNSIWLNLYSIFFLGDKNFDFLTLPSFILFLTFILFSITQIINSKNILISDFYLIVILFYFILKFTRISEFGVDLPSIIFSILGIYYFIKFHETNLIEEKKNFFLLVIYFSIFSILIKLSTLPIIFLSLYLYFKNFKKLKYFIFNFKFFFISLIFLSFLIQQFIYTGCLFFPNKLTCFDLRWFNSEYLNLSKNLELINKSYYQGANNIFSPEQYLNNFNWFSYWIKRNFTLISENLLTIFLPSLLFLVSLKNKNKIDILFKEKFILFIFLMLGFIFWLYFSPVYRFAVHLFVTIIFVLLTKLFLSKVFSKKNFIFFISIFVLFSFSKNLNRLIKVEDIFIGVQKINNNYILNETDSNEFAKIFVPDVENNNKNGWQGRLCWNTPFICSYNKLEVKRKNGYLMIIKMDD